MRYNKLLVIIKFCGILVVCQNNWVLSMKITVQLIKAFTQDKEHGNPAGVVLNADDLSDQQMQGIAKHYNFSECVFVQKSDAADFKTRFFTPIKEVDFCGHATIAAFYCLSKDLVAGSPIIFTQETNKGILQVSCYPDGLIVMQQQDPSTFNFVINNNEIANLLNIAAHDIMGDSQIVSTGIPKLIIPLKSLEVLFSINPNFTGICEYSLKSGSKGFYPFTTQTIDTGSDFHARQFNPLVGINEDPITGIAAGALGSYIVSHHLSDKKTFVIEQGHIMNKFGKMFVDVSDKILVGGYAIEYGSEELIV
jgi:PhzF family phenazine biosynthesis protein